MDSILKMKRMWAFQQDDDPRNKAKENINCMRKKLKLLQLRQCNIYGKNLRSEFMEEAYST